MFALCGLYGVLSPARLRLRDKPLAQQRKDAKSSTGTGPGSESSDEKGSSSEKVGRSRIAARTSSHIPAVVAGG